MLIDEIDAVRLKFTQGSIDGLPDPIRIASDAAVCQSAKLGGQEDLISLSRTFEPFSDQFLAVPL